MTRILLLLFALSLRLPDVQTFEPLDWQPAFTDPRDLKIQQDTLALVTHATRHFDPLKVTQAAVHRVTATMKERQLPLICLHDQYNENNPPWMYLYSDRCPTAFVRSDVGHIDLDLSSVRHVVVLGGYFGQCERSTVADSIKCWRRDSDAGDFRVTQVVDGVFCVSEFVRFEDSYAADVRALFYGDLKKRHPKASISVHQILSLIDDPDMAIEFLCRQLPRIPHDVNVVIDFFGRLETVRVLDQEAPILTLAYRTSTDFLEFELAKPELKKPDRPRLLSPMKL